MDVAVDEAVILSLRHATQLHHRALEDLLELAAPLSRSRYVETLKGFERFLFVWEPCITTVLPARLCEWFAGRSRYRLLRQDIHMLDVEPRNRPEAELVSARAVRGIGLGSLAATFGSMYVLEGSALGGQVIARQVRDTLDLGPVTGAAYFNGFGQETAARWGDFRGRLEAEVGVEPRARQEACHAATQTFDALIATFKALRP